MGAFTRRQAWTAFNDRVKYHVPNLRGEGFGRNVAVLAFGTALGRGLTAAAAPLLTRLYTPSDFGLFSVFFSAVTLVVSLAALNYDSAIPVPEDENVALSLLLLCFCLLGLGTVLVSGFVWLGSGMIARWLGVPELAGYLWLVPISMLGGGTFIILNSWAIRVRAFGALSKRRIIQSLAQVATQTAVPGIAGGPIGLMLGDCIGRSAGSLALWRMVTARTDRQDASQSFGKMLRVAGRFSNFPTFGLACVVFHTGLSFLPPFLFAASFGLPVAGSLTLVNQVVGLAVGIVGLSVAQVFTGKAAVVARTDPDELHRLFVRTSRMSLCIGGPPLAALALLGPIVFPVVFGARWSEAGVYGQLLAIPLLVTFVVGPVFPVLTLLERQRWQVWADALGLTMMVAGVRVARIVGAGPRWGIASYGIALSMTYALLYLLAWRAIQCHKTRLEARA